MKCLLILLCACILSTAVLAAGTEKSGIGHVAAAPSPDPGAKTIHKRAPMPDMMGRRKRSPTDDMMGRGINVDQVPWRGVHEDQIPWH